MIFVTALLVRTTNCVNWPWDKVCLVSWRCTLTVKLWRASVSPWQCVVCVAERVWGRATRE